MTFKPIEGMPGYYEWDAPPLTRQEFLKGIEVLKSKIPRDSKLYDFLDLEKYPNSNPNESSFHIHRPL